MMTKKLRFKALNGLELEIPSNEILELEPAIETLGYVNEIKSKRWTLHVRLENFLNQAIKNYDLIISNPRYYLIRIDFFTSGLMYLGDLKSITLGALLDCWHLSDELNIYYKNHQYSLCYIGGSPLTNKFNALAYNVSDSTLLKLDTNLDNFKLHGKLVDWTDKFKKLNIQIPWEITNKKLNIYKLCGDLGLN